MLDDLACHLSSNTRWMIGGHHVLEEVARHRNETLGFGLSVQTLASLHGQHHADVFICQRRAFNVFKGFAKHCLVLLIIRKQDKVCDGVECQLIDEAGRMRQAPRPLKIARFATVVKLIVFEMAAIT